jgi:ParB-like chromosome segregation protein Spo0J
MSVVVHHSQPLDPNLVDLPDDNPNHMTVEELDALREFIQSRGFLQPVLVTPGKGESAYIVVDGHHRIKAARRLKMPEISAIVVPATEAERIRDRIAMNKNRGELDATAVARDLERLLTEFDDPKEVALTGFNADDIETMLDAVRTPVDLDQLRDEGMAPPPPEDTDTGPKTYAVTARFDTELDRARVKECAMEHSQDGTLASGLVEMAKALESMNDD